MKVSIVTISLNAKNHIRETIDSVLSQKDDEVEYIIQDGGSTDGTLDIVNSFGDRIDKVFSEPDKGISDAFNKGIENATGDIICLVNSGDILYMGAIRTIREFYERESSIDILYGDTMVFTDVVDKGYLVKADTDLKKLRYAFLLPHPGMFISRRAYKQYGLYSTNLKNAMDYELVSRMYFNGAKLVYTNTVLSGFREGGTSQVALDRTLKEHRTIAKRNGAGFFEREKYIVHVWFRRKTAPILKKLGVENALQKLVKRR